MLLNSLLFIVQLLFPDSCHFKPVICMPTTGFVPSKASIWLMMSWWTQPLLYNYFSLALSVCNLDWPGSVGTRTIFSFIWFCPISQDSPTPRGAQAQRIVPSFKRSTLKWHTTTGSETRSTGAEGFLPYWQHGRTINQKWWEHQWAFLWIHCRFDCEFSIKSWETSEYDPDKKKTTCQSQVGLGFSSIANLLVRSARKAQWPFGKEGPMAIFAMAHFSSDRDVQHHYISILGSILISFRPSESGLNGIVRKPNYCIRKRTLWMQYWYCKLHRLSHVLLQSLVLFARTAWNPEGALPVGFR